MFGFKDFLRISKRDSKVSNFKFRNFNSYIYIFISIYNINMYTDKSLCIFI